VGWVVDGFTSDDEEAEPLVTAENITVTSPNIKTYTFSRSADDWRVATGTWEVTNRGSCDPRWSWFSRVNTEGLASIWHKSSFRGDVTVEFFAGIKMLKLSPGYPRYARDIDVTICADGKQVTHGYQFLFGGFANKKTALYRFEEPLQEVEGKEVVFPLHWNTHRRWFYFKVRKTGNRLRLYWNDKVLLDQTDSELLNGDRIALWTYKNGIMISRVRLSAEHIGPKESPDFMVPETAVSLYDDEEKEQEAQ
jgi:hypothetical protein